MPKERGEALGRCLQRAIERIEGVSTARVILGENDEISEIHLVSSSPRRPKQVVRDIESLLNAQFGIHVDYRRISLVQISSESALATHKRIQLVSAQPLLPAENSVQVTLQDDHSRYEGVSLCASAEQNDEPHTRAAASATLTALQQTLTQSVQLAVHEVQTVHTDDQQVALVIVLAGTPNGQERLTGTCIIRHSLIEAVAKATLDAVNRRLPFWTALQDRQPS